MTPASMQKVIETQETRIQEIKSNADARIADANANADARVADARQQTQEWKDKASDALTIVSVQGKQLDVVTELGETSVKLLEAVHGARFGVSDEQKARTTHVVRPGREG